MTRKQCKIKQMVYWLTMIVKLQYRKCICLSCYSMHACEPMHCMFDTFIKIGDFTPVAFYIGTILAFRIGTIPLASYMGCDAIREPDLSWGLCNAQHWSQISKLKAICS